MRTVRQEGRREPALARNERILRLSSPPPFATTSDTHGWPLKNARGVGGVATCVHVSTSASRTSRHHPSITDAASEPEQAQQLRIQIPTVRVRHHPAAARPTRHADVLAARLQSASALQAPQSSSSDCHRRSQTCEIFFRSRADRGRACCVLHLAVCSRSSRASLRDRAGRNARTPPLPVLVCDSHSDSEYF